jgi:hypothetical protein
MKERSCVQCGNEFTAVRTNGKPSGYSRTYCYDCSPFRGVRKLPPNVCKNCGIEFDDIVIDGKRRSRRGRIYCWTCSPHGEIDKRLLSKTTKQCPACEMDLPFDSFYGKKGGNKKSNDCNTYCKSCELQYAVNVKRKRKIDAISRKGGCCVFCGYSKCVSGLHFHHINPEEKEVAISQAKSLDLLYKELDKCMLVCANHHAEIESGMIDEEEIHKRA